MRNLVLLLLTREKINYHIIKCTYIIVTISAIGVSLHKFIFLILGNILLFYFKFNDGLVNLLYLWNDTTTYKSLIRTVMYFTFIAEGLTTKYRVFEYLLGLFQRT